VKRNSLWDIAASLLSVIGIAMPAFWLGMLMIILFSITLGWLPASGYIPFWENPLGNLQRMVMPVVTVALAFMATIMRQTRSAMLEVLSQDYILTARAKGLKGRLVLFRHALRNALIPVVTVVAMQTGRLVGGAVVTETVFALPGIGREIVDAIMARDYPVAMALILIVVFAVVFMNLFADIMYVLIDPRISSGRSAMAMRRS
jgi:peptide/nickel transport system permease protein